MISFTSIDFETAIGKRWSICQVGIVRVENGKVTKKICKLVKPPGNEYSEINSRVHGITANDTESELNFFELWNEIKPYFENSLIVAHNIDFDIDCLYKTLEYYNIAIPEEPDRDSIIYVKHTTSNLSIIIMLDVML